MTIIRHVEQTTYLGILIHHSLKSDSHIKYIISRANSKLGFIKRNLKGCPRALKRSAYLGLVRSGLEYGAIVWDPHHDYKCDAIELVQNKAMRWINGLPPYDRRHIRLLLADTGITSLEQRRRDARITMLYKMVHGLVNITTEELGLVPSDKRTRAAHRYKFKEEKAKVDLSRFSYVNRTVPDWNRLPAAVAEADPKDLDIFRTQLASARRP